MQKPAGKPCDLQKIQIKCKHCGQKDKREEFAEGVFELDQAARTVRSNYPEKIAHGEPKKDVFEVVAAASESYQDDITITVTPEQQHDRAAHPSITVTEPQEVGGKSVSHPGKTTIELPVRYPKDWFHERVKEAAAERTLSAILAVFTPPPVVYDVLIQSCGVRQADQVTFRLWHHRIAVYPDDVFKLTLDVPAYKTKVRERGGGKIGDSKYESHKSTDETSFGQDSSSTEDRTYSTDGHTVLQQTDVVKILEGGIKETQTLGDTTGLPTRDDYVSEEGTDHVALAAARSLTISRNAADVTNEFKVAVAIEDLLKFRKRFLEVVDLIRAIATQMPQVGWSVSGTLDILSGKLEIEVCWNEWKKGNIVYSNLKIDAGITLFEGTLKLSFGAKICGASAEIYGQVSMDLAVHGHWEPKPDESAWSTLVTTSPKGKVGVRGALGDAVVVEGDVTVGIEGETKMEFWPFKWTVKADWAKAKGTFSVQIGWGLWEYNKEWTLWEKTTLFDEIRLI